MNKKTGEIYQRSVPLPPSSTLHEGTKLTTFDNGKNLSIACELYDDAVFMLNCLKGNLQLLKDSSGKDLDELRQKLQKDFDFCARNLAEAATWHRPAKELLIRELCPLAQAYQFKLDSNAFEQGSLVVVRKKDFVVSSPTIQKMHTVAGIMGQGFIGTLFNYVQEKYIPEDVPTHNNDGPK
jgi:hypothetical protein